MKNFISYKTYLLAKTSEAAELLELAKKSSDYKKLDEHLKNVENIYEKMHGKMPTKYVNFKIGDI